MTMASEWVAREKKPVPRKYLINSFVERQVPVRTTEESIKTLIRKGYIRKAVSTRHEVEYVLLRTHTVYN